MAEPTRPDPGVPDRADKPPRTPLVIAFMLLVLAVAITVAFVIARY